MCAKKTIAIVPGSFDPITNGHVFIIEEAAKRYDKIYVAVMINSNKQYTFTLEERKNIAIAALKNISNVEVISSEGWLYDLANSLNADAIVKGYRNEIDLQYENEMAEFNRAHAPDTKTVLIKSPQNLSFLSSTLVREKLKDKNNIKDLLPNNAIDLIENILSKRQKS
ncbi:MAG: pantetheine-phosphate adenylyltransferase [Ruminococcaceae bacterium]|nr:pantetheine-phosphate adenylyltransferase [Oscillospiraceae bacterium]